MRNILVVLVGGSMCACASQPPAATAPRPATSVSASFGRSWDAVIDVFAEHNIPIRNMERASGLIVTDAMSVTKSDWEYADCGTIIGMPRRPTTVSYNVLVRGDSMASTVKVTPRWVQVLDATKSEACGSRGTWESAFESRVKATAEAKRGP